MKNRFIFCALTLHCKEPVTITTP